MSLRDLPRPMGRALGGASVVALICCGLASASQSADVDQTADHQRTATPIKHVIVLIGENHSFDNIYATFVPHSGDKVKNLLSQGIVNADGSPGPHFDLAKQFKQVPVNGKFRQTYFIGLNASEKTPYNTLPVPGQTFAPATPIDVNTFAKNFPQAPISGASNALLAQLEPSLDADDLHLLTTGATGLTPDPEPFPQQLAKDIDTRIANFDHLKNGPFQLTGPKVPYDSFSGDSTHRLYEMWQQSDCSIANATEDNPSGCLNDLYPYVITTYVGGDDEGGSNSMAFFNMQTGDVPVLKRLSDEFTISDNFHQSFTGGTGMNHMMMGTGDVFFWSDGNGNPTTPPAGVIANPNPQPGTENTYIVDRFFNGNFTDCANAAKPEVTAITSYLANFKLSGVTCQDKHFYYINNTAPGFLPTGEIDTAGIAKGGSIPPQTIRSVGEALNEKGISWAYYGGAYNNAVALQQALDKDPDITHVTDPVVLSGQTYCNICNFESYITAIMGDPTQRAAHIKDAVDFFTAVDNDELPSVSFLKPDSFIDGHPASSKPDLFEAMVENVVDRLSAKPELFAETALIITMDEGGGYYDTGFIQPLDFFGDGPRIPLIVVSPFTRGGHVSHAYADHVSILKFIERNWGLKPLTNRSRDNLPNPKADRDNPYVPTNMPAISDLFDIFHMDGDDLHGDRGDDDGKKPRI
jgi:phospholipase C